VRARVLRPERIREAVLPEGPVIARGLGRSYGDAAALADGNVLLMERLDRMLDFDAASGRLTAEAGVTIADVLEAFVPRGWFPPVTPGTKFVTLGGCFAADVHGKNHHRAGTFSAHVEEIRILLADGSLRTCSREREHGLFWATAGGMGLTGVIVELTLRLSPIDSAYVLAEHRATRDIDEAFAILADDASDDETSMAWVDCTARAGRLGRAIVMRGHHAAEGELAGRAAPSPARAKGPFDLPFDLPSWAIFPSALGAFNDLYYRFQSRRRGPFLTHYHPYFYPLDAVGRWNRAYGSAGFTQYQCVIPDARAREGIAAILAEIRRARMPSTLAVLKRFGPAGPGPLSFPASGFTLALDFPLADPAVFPFLDALDRITLDAGGRVYLAKDARLRPETFRAMYPRFGEWLEVKHAVDAEWRFASDLSRRLRLEAGP
jgi:FAD/FMN-containing dehydrogenase